MDPVSLILAALAAGAVAGTQDVTTQAVKDAYAGLKGAITRLFGGRPSGAAALEGHEKSPEAWRPALEAELFEVNAGTDQEAVTAAQRLMQLVDAAGSQEGKYLVDARYAQGVQVGDHNTQTLNFGKPPAS